MADGWFANPHALISTLDGQMSIYKAALEYPGPERDIPVMREVFVGETRAEALAAGGPGLERRYGVYINQGQDEAQPEGAVNAAVELISKSVKRLASVCFGMSIDRTLADEVNPPSLPPGCQRRGPRTPWVPAFETPSRLAT